jgi:hypothetical protein
MAITQAQSADRLTRRGPGRTLFESGKSAVTLGAAACTWGQGVLLCLDAATFLLRPVAATADAATLAGLSDNVVNSGKLQGPYDGLTAVDAASQGPDFSGPKIGVTGTLTLKTGDAFTPGCKVYLADGLDSATVSVTDPGDHNYVGLYSGPAVTAAAGATGPIFVGARTQLGTGAALIF